ncbi:hypothetical protein BUH_1763 [Burkholderia pseudomallei Pakistan 9]|uniref:Uncharacterized protein n=2 Tax=Burkholderia pseudomallei TaxID=28450 RepID=A0A0E1W7Y3_BURPE|nr:hypothetical protein BURPS1106A_2130 [Burkholderia pseudomallei 1106a]EEC35497.1 hypothetical protein BUC_1953 [Burkholderia pseudomallei 576]EEH26739.1 hypothetical protein BUH_1763 [Burkholderia pseudomallei Pakistan 9]EET09313.1 hypothetical protein BURPS1710A_2626 [Burkholderia pseudomallei 1710a]
MRGRTAPVRRATGARRRARAPPRMASSIGARRGRDAAAGYT